MSEETLAKIFKKIFASGRVGKELSVVWHAGEPMVLPVSYYDKAFAIAEKLKPSGIVLRHNFQTNGTLITEDWCRFIKQEDIAIGISIDGPKPLHDACRVSRAGKGSFDDAMAGLALLHRHAIPFHVISVITKDTLFYPDELFAFYGDNGIKRFAFNVEEVEGVNETSTLSRDTEALYRRFIERIFDLVEETDDLDWMREYNEAFGRVLSSPDRKITNTQNEPFAILTIDHNGNFSTYSPELLGMRHDDYGDFVFGNLVSSDLETALASDKYRRIEKEILDGIEKCRRSCEFFDVCGGGAPSNKLFETGTFDATETMHCRYVCQIPTEIAVERLEKRVIGSVQDVAV